MCILEPRSTAGWWLAGSVAGGWRHTWGEATSSFWIRAGPKYVAAEILLAGWLVSWPRGVAVKVDERLAGGTLARSIMQGPFEFACMLLRSLVLHRYYATESLYPLKRERTHEACAR